MDVAAVEPEKFPFDSFQRLKRPGIGDSGSRA